MMMLDALATVASLQNLIATRFQAAAAGHKPGQLVQGGFARLRDQLGGADKLPRGLAWNPLMQPDLLDLTSVARADSPLGLLGGLIKGLDDRLKALVAAHTPEDVAAAFAGLFKDHGQVIEQKVLPLLRSQAGLLVSLATTTQNLPGAGPQIEEALLEYFFDPDGFHTVDDVRLVAPVHLADLKSPDAVKSTLSKGTGEQYVRDLVRLIVEAADDVRYDLRSRRDTLRKPLPNAAQAKFDGWFRGFPAMAESATMQAVEEATLGVSQFQTNAIIAAAAGTFAGTVARKAAQHVFLREFESA